MLAIAGIAFLVRTDFVDTTNSPTVKRSSSDFVDSGVLREQVQQDELASLRQLRCDVKLLSGELDHDIAILNIFA